MYSVLAGGSGHAYCAFRTAGTSPAFDEALYFGIQPKQSFGTIVARFSEDGSTLEGSAQFASGGGFFVELEGQFSDGDIFAIGSTLDSGPDFEVGDGLQFGEHGGLVDFFLMRFESSLNDLNYSLVYGSGDSAGIARVAECIVLEDDSVFCNSHIPPSDLPTTSNAWQPTHSQPGATGSQKEDNYFFHFSGDGQELLFASYYGLAEPPDPGGSINDQARGIAVAGDVIWLLNSVELNDGLPPLPVGVPEYVMPTGALGELSFTILRFDWRRQVVLSRLLTGYPTTLSSVGLADGSLLFTYDADGGVPLPTPGGTPFGFEGWQGIQRIDALGEGRIFNHAMGGSPSEPFGTSIPLGMVAVGPEEVLLGGQTEVSDLPTTPGVPDSFMAPNDPADGFIQLLDVTPAGIRRVGEPSGGCDRHPIAGILKRPVAGEATFGLTCAGAPPATIGVLALSAGRAIEPAIPLENLSLYVDPGTFDLLPVITDDSGFARVALPIPASALGAVVTAQFGFVEDPPDCLQLVASDALEITVFSDR